MNLARLLPNIREPEREQSLKQMLTWTGIVLVLYFFLGQVSLWAPSGVAEFQQAISHLETFQTLLGAQIGSLITLGIGPIVTSSIVLQMMVGSEVIPWNTNTERGKQKFQSSQKVLAYSLALIQAVGYVLSGTFGGPFALPITLLITLEIAAGGWLIILLDELVQKWGFGSGTGLFIAAGVSKSIYVQTISPLTQAGSLYWIVGGQPVGAIVNFLNTLALTDLIPVIATLLIFLTTVYLQAMKVEIPLTFGNVRGFGQKWPLKFLYTSTMPVILVSAFISNLQIVGTTLAGNNGCSVLGCFSNGQASSGLVNLLTAPQGFVENLFIGGFSELTVSGVSHVLFYVLIYTLGSILFSIFWMKTSGQDADSVAEQIQQTGMKVPGFRKDKRVIKKVLNRYIPGLTVMSGAVMGILVSLAGMTNAAGGGTGILLTVMIIYRMYEQIAQKHMEELHPAMKNFFE